MSADTLQPDSYTMVDKKIRASSFSSSTCPSRVHTCENVDVDDIPALPTLFAHDYDVQGDGYRNTEIDNCSLSLPPPSLIPPHDHENRSISTVSDEKDLPE